MPDIAGDALRYQGAGYVYGGVPADGIGNWDCSSFVNWVVGNDCGMAIPGFVAGSYHGQNHGPVVLDWATWTGASTVQSASRGSLCVWAGVGASGHIGIAISSNQMISALNHEQGTVVTPIQGYGPAGVALIYRNLSGNTGSGISLPTGCFFAMVSYALQYQAKRGRYLSSGQFAYGKGAR